MMKLDYCPKCANYDTPTLNCFKCEFHPQDLSAYEQTIAKIKDNSYISDMVKDEPQEIDISRPLLNTSRKYMCDRADFTNDHKVAWIVQEQFGITENTDYIRWKEKMNEVKSLLESEWEYDLWNSINDKFGVMVEGRLLE